MTHHVKCWPPYFEHIRAGIKRFEIRKNDRGYQLGDKLNLLEWDPHTRDKTGRSFEVYISYIFRDELLGLQPGFVILGF